MNQILANKKIGKFIFLICLLLFIQTSFVRAAEDITGEWEIKIDRGGLESFATLSISKKADGTLGGKWGSSELTNVRFEERTLTFTRTRKTRALNFINKYTLTLQEGKLIGTLSTDFGDFPLNGTRKKAKSPVRGQWNVKYNIGEREITAKLTISEKPDGTLFGKWDTEFGEHIVSNVTFQKSGKLTYTRKSKLGESEWESTFEGTIEGHKLAGAFKNQRGEILLTGERIGAALVGKWELTTTSYGNTSKSIMKIDGDLTGRYEFPEGSELPIKNIRLEGDQVTFALDWYVRDLNFKMDFKGKLYGKTLLKGKLEGKTIKGKHIFDKYTNEVTGKKID